MQSAISPLFQKAALLGTGMMGTSLGIELRRLHLAHQVVCWDASPLAMQQAMQAEAAHETACSLQNAVQQADLVVFATPVETVPALMHNAAPFVTPYALVTDIGGVKTRIVQAGEQLFGSRFVGGHPMAGSPKSGAPAARPQLFAGAAWAVVRTALPDPNETYCAKLVRLAEALGAVPLFLQAQQHDRLAALVSHLPHVLSFAYAKTLAGETEQQQARALAGGSCSDMLRVSASSRTLWKGIFQENRDCLLQQIDYFERALHALRTEIAAIPQHAASTEKGN